MKKLFSMLVMISYSIIFLQAQVNNAGKLQIITQTEANNIKLRWMLTDHDAWAEGNSAGYSLSRYTTHSNGVQLSFVEMQASLVLLADNILPMPEAQWNNDFTDNPFATVAKGALYSDDNSVIISGTPSLADAYNQVESSDARFLFGLFAAEQDFAVAEGMGLGYEDNNIVDNTTYLYRLVLNSTNAAYQDISAGAIATAGKLTILPAIETPYGKGEDKAVMLQWDMVESKENYSTYDVEKSIDGITFEKVNDLPFVFAAEGVDEPEVAVFKDKLSDNNTSYHYRVRGRTPFGTQGPPSETVQLKGIPPRINLLPAFSDYIDEQTIVKVLWNGFEPTLQSQVVEFNIYRSKKANKDFTKVNVIALAANATLFQDDTPLQTAYYQLEVIDNNGYSYISPAMLVQLSDEEPPAIPTGLAGHFITSSQLQLDWDANTEEDLKGYRLFIANKAGSVFTQITSNVVKENTYIYEIDPQFMVDNIFIKILASDFRDNYSAKSEAIAVARPDVVPPSSPVLYKAIPTPAGIEFGFKFSSSEDRIGHTLQYKPENTANWDVALKIERENEGHFLVNLTPDAITSTYYIMPNTDLERRPYQFRMIAEDESGNISGSQIITIRPYHSGIRGEIKDFGLTVALTEIPVPINPAHVLLDEVISIYETTQQIDYDKFEQLYILGLIPEQKYNQLMGIFLPFLRGIQIHGYLVELRGTIVAPLPKYSAETTLEWTYESKDQLEDFQIFRSAEGGSLMLYKTISVADISSSGYDYFFIDSDVKVGYRYFYQVMARHSGGAFSPRSETIMVKVQQ